MALNAIDNLTFCVLNSRRNDYSGAKYDLLPNSRIIFSKQLAYNRLVFFGGLFQQGIPPPISLKHTKNHSFVRKQ